MEAKDILVNTICVGICDGNEGRCEKYPKLSTSCDKFLELEKSYKAGMKQGIWLYAWWKDGVQYVGTTGRTLAEALKEIDDGN